MPYEVLQYVVGRALIDPAFQSALLRSPSVALNGVRLSEEERQLLQRADPRSLQRLARSVDAWLDGQAARSAPAPQPARSLFDDLDEFADATTHELPVEAPVTLRKSA